MKKTITLLFLILSLFQFVSSQIYVDENASGNNNGTSWDDAYVLLDSALINAQPDDSVFIAEGFYFPHLGVDFDASGDTSRREATFIIPDGVKVLGGYPEGGGGRDIETYFTILSGASEVAGEDTSFHVIYFREVSDETLLDGVIIENGKTGMMTGPVTDSIGGAGILNAVYSSSASSSPVIRNCTFRNNAGFVGAGLCNYASGGTANPSILNCLFTGNIASIGGGIANFSFNEGTISSKIIDCEFSENTAYPESEPSSGAGMANLAMGGESNVHLIGCTFENNETGDDGGAFIYSAGTGLTGTGQGTGQIIMEQCVFTGNHSTGGGAFSGYADANGTMTVRLYECEFNENTAIDVEDYGGGGAFYASSDSAGSTTLTLSQCTFNNDSVIAPDWGSGGAMQLYCDPFAEMLVTIDTCTFTGNYASHAGGGLNISVDSSSNAELSLNGCEFIDNMADINEGGGVVSTSHKSGVLVQEFIDCDFQGNYTGGNGGALYISSERGEISPVIEGCSFYGNIADNFGGGMYSSCWGKAAGGAGENTPDIKQCVFEADTSRNGSGGGLYAFYSDATISHTTFSNNQAFDGGALGTNHSNCFVTDCDFLENEAINNGGAVSNFESSPQFSYCTLEMNSAGQSAGGMFNNNSGSGIEYSTFRNNVAQVMAGALQNLSDNNSDCMVQVTNTIISGNQADYGGGMANYSANNSLTYTILKNCVISGNYATHYGGAVLDQSQATGTTNSLTSNTTIAGNMAGDFAGALFNQQNGGTCNPTYLNSIVWGNSRKGGQIVNDNTIPGYSFCNIQGSGGSTDWVASMGTDNGNNIDLLPHFVSTPDTLNAPSTEGDLSILLSSPCVDAGDIETPANLITNFDLVGNNRVFNDTIDMGAYEFTPYPVIVTGISDIVVNEDAPDSTIADLNDVFEDPLQGSNLTFIAQYNSNEDLLSFFINSDDSTLVLSFNTDSSGSAQLAVQAENNYGYTITDTFEVTVNAVNDSPIAADATFNLAEDAENGDLVGTVTASDVDDETLSYSISSGNDDGIFGIQSESGSISVVDNTNLDYETTIGYSLVVEVGDGEASDEAEINIIITDVDEPGNALNAVTSTNRLLYPNPAKDYIILETEDTGIYSVIDINGKEVTRLQSGKNNISHLEPGIYYIINIREEDNRLLNSFVKK